MIDLNEAQRSAVTAEDGPALVLAGAGSGKTRVIVERLVWLVEERGLDPRRLLALTFTNRAAREMRERVTARLGLDRLAAWVGTFHGFGLYVLRRDIERLGRPKTFTIFDDGDQLSLMKRLIKGLPGRYTKVSPRDGLEWISRRKQGIPDEALATADEIETFQELTTRYQDVLIGASALDFDDLLALLAQLLRDHQDVREKYQRRFTHVLIDEYQDTNRLQYEITKLLTDSHRNVFAVGDEDQSIYSWRGADVRNILDFEKDFPGARVFRLEQNYRSTKPILSAANAVVKNNKGRLGKTLWTSAEAGDPVRFYHARDADDEARFVVDDLVASKASPNEAAILYRTNGQARVIEETLRRKGVPYVIIGGIRFYSRKEIKDLLAYLRLLVNPSDDESLRRVLNVPARGIGSVTMERLEDYAASRKMPLFEVLREIEHDHTILPRARDAAESFVRLIDDLILESRTALLQSLLEILLDKTKYRDFIRESDEKDYRSRMENIDELLASCTQFDARDGGGVMEFLQELALFTEVDDWDASTPAVTLMTCHSAKGLEFDRVYLVGLEEGLLPHALTQDSASQIEEERRLCYVAMTRARKVLTLAAAQSRVMWGDSDERRVSRFVREIPPELIQIAGREKTGQAVTAPARAEVDTGQVKLGTRVRHAKFGAGSVVYTAGSGANLRARIRFQTGRVSTFLISKTPLEILEEKKR